LPGTYSSAVLQRVLLVAVAWAILASPRPALAAAPLRITLDPGHGGPEVGASYRFADGVVLQEKALNLRVTIRLRDLLSQAGHVVTLTRTTDALVNADGRDVNGDGRVSLADDLQARVDTANRAGSDLFVAIHFNGSSDASMRGTYTFWNADRPFAERSRTLAQDVQTNLLAALRAAGYTSLDRGARTDAWLLGSGNALFVLGPQSGPIARPSQMPAIIAEPLFLTNPHDAAALRDDKIVDAVAQGLFDGIRAYAAPHKTRPLTALTALPAVLGTPVAAPSRTAWTVWAVTYQDTVKGERLSTQALQALTARGLPGRVLSSPPSAPSRPSYLVVTSGTFPTRAAAAAHATRLRQAGYPDALVRPLNH
jgi:N-acetylmuramoyl-L-alanine amidase